MNMALLLTKPEDPNDNLSRKAAAFLAL